MNATTNTLTIDEKDRPAVLTVYADSDSVSVDLGDPDAAGVPGRHALEQWTLILSATLSHVAETVYGGIDGSYQLTQELLLRVRHGIDLAIEQSDRDYHEKHPGDSAESDTPMITDGEFLQQLEEINEEEVDQTREFHQGD